MKQLKSIGLLLVMSVMCVAACVCIAAKSKAAHNDKWQSVHACEFGKKTICYYVKYGDLSIARNSQTAYVKTGTDNTSIEVSSSGYGYGGLLTNGEEVLYQKGKSVYLWKNGKVRKKLLSFKKRNDILLARYKNSIFYGRYDDYDSYRLYRYNFMTKKTTKLPYYNAYYSYGKYLIVGGAFHEGWSTTLTLYNMQTGKLLTLAQKAAYGNAAIIDKGAVYYTELADSTGWEAPVWKIATIDIKTKKKKVLQKKRKERVNWLDKNRFAYYKDSDTDNNLYVYDLRNNKEVCY